jgi:uncharacterized protein
MNDLNVLPAPFGSSGYNDAAGSSAMTVAIVGSGIAGMACAHFLQRSHAITLFEQDRRIGGHAHTLEVGDLNRGVPFDTGFMVYNEVTYPLLTRLFAELKVETKPTSMSFSVRHDPERLEYCGSSLNHLFAQRANLLRPRFWRFLRRIDHFNREAVAALNDPAVARQTVEEYVRVRGYGDDFLQLFLLPMSGAVWSAPPREMLRFPAATLLRFFHNHGFLGLHTQHPWRTVTGGSREYVQKLTAPFRHRIQTGCAVTRISRTGAGAEIHLADGRAARFDRVVLACHADQALRLLADPTPLERRLLGAFSYQANDIAVHCDESVMPRTRRAWASWNYRIRATGTGAPATSTHYWMNSLQLGPRPENYFVSLNAAGEIAPERVIRRMVYRHPLFDLRAIRAQQDLPRLNRLHPGQTTFFAGSYFRYGFHEDALSSGCDAAGALLGRDPWAPGSAADARPVAQTAATA